jgi:hypothetical protein
VTLAEIGVALFIRNRNPLAREDIALPGDASPSVQKWLTVQIVSYAIAISVALYGIVLRFLGGSLTKTLPFYAIAIVMLISWWPRKR